MKTSKVMIDLILPLPDVIVWSSRVVHAEISGINLGSHSPLLALQVCGSNASQK